MRKRKPTAKFPQLIHIFLVLSLSLNLFLLLNPGGIAGDKRYLSLQELGVICEPGTYGPLDMEIVEGSLTISAAGVKLQNTRITGALILTAAVGDGSAEIFKVTVEDTALVQGGGENTVVFEDAVINHLVINREEGKVRVVLKGNTVVEKLTIIGETCLSTGELSGEGLVKEIFIETAAETELEGVFDNITVAGKEARVTLLSGQIKKLSTIEGAAEALITLKEGAAIELLAAEAPLEIAGEGLVKEATVATPGLFKFSGSVEKISAGGRGIFLEFGSGSTDTLLVEESEGTVMIHLAQGAVVKYMELNGPAGVTGSGAIERVLISAPGTTIEQSPGSVELAEGIKAKVAGKEITVKQEKEEPAPAAPSTPTVSIGAISNRVMGPGETAAISLAVSPGDAAISISSSDTGIATVSLSGRTLKITAGTKQGTATITVKATRAGYNSRTRTFKVTMDPIEVFETGEKMPLVTVVSVKLKYKDAQNYKVYVGNKELTYDPDDRFFYGDVDTKDAVRSNVRVVGQ
ncbi:MAG TPA: hypothetical protein PKY23_10440 [Bacillota bacterium]|nr:hypothetical protein [Bacillota bacterium]